MESADKSCTEIYFTRLLLAEMSGIFDNRGTMLLLV